MSQRDTITVKEIASVLNVSQDTVRRRRKQWGLEECRCRMVLKPITFFRMAASEALVRSKVVNIPPW